MCLQSRNQHLYNKTVFFLSHQTVYLLIRKSSCSYVVCCSTACCLFIFFFGAKNRRWRGDFRAWDLADLNNPNYLQRLLQKQNPQQPLTYKNTISSERRRKPAPAFFYELNNTGASAGI